MAREYEFYRLGTVVRHVRKPGKWGVLVSTDDGRIFTVRWRGGEEERVPWTLLIRAAAPCRECGERASDHKPGDDHEFLQETH